jgi:hypothetical protein
MSEPCLQEAPSEVTRHRATPTPGAARQRRYRARQRRGAVRIEFEILPSALAALVAGGWLDPERRGDRDAVRRAIVQIARRALELKLRPDAGR